MYDHGSSVNGITTGHFPHKQQEWSGVLRYSVIWPHGIVELLHNPLLFRAIHLQGKCANGILSQNQCLLEIDMDGVIHFGPLHLIWPVLMTLELRKMND